MGSSMKNQLLTQYPPRFNWMPATSDPNSCSMLDKSSRMLGDRYLTSLPETAEERACILVRKWPSPYLVQIYSFECCQEQKLCSYTNMMRVVIEHIPYRLPDVGTISFSEAIYILQVVLRGYTILQQQGIRLRQLQEGHICFTDGGRCKLWMNEALQLNRFPGRQSCEEEVVHDLFTLVEERIQGAIPKEYRRIAAPKTLQQALSYICPFVSHVSCIKALSVLKPIKEEHLKMIPKQSVLLETFMHQFNGKQCSVYKLSVSKHRVRRLLQSEGKEGLAIKQKSLLDRIMEGKSEWGDGRGREWQKINFTEEREEEGERNTAKDNQNPNECLVVESKMDQSWQGNNKTKKMIKASQETTIKAECVDREDREDREHQEAGRRIFLAARKKGVSLEGGINRHVFPNQSNLLAKLHAEKKIGRIGSRQLLRVRKWTAAIQQIRSN